MSPSANRAIVLFIANGRMSRIELILQADAQADCLRLEARAMPQGRLLVRLWNVVSPP